MARRCRLPNRIKRVLDQIPADARCGNCKKQLGKAARDCLCNIEADPRVTVFCDENCKTAYLKKHEEKSDISEMPLAGICFSSSNSWKQKILAIMPEGKEMQLVDILRALSPDKEVAGMLYHGMVTKQFTSLIKWGDLEHTGRGTYIKPTKNGGKAVGRV